MSDNSSNLSQSRPTEPENDSGESVTREPNDTDKALEGVSQAVEQLPPVIRQVMEMGFFASGPAANPVLRKVNEEHISSMIQIASTAEQHGYEQSKENKKIGLRVFYIVTGVLFGLLMYFQWAKALDEIIPVLLGFIAFAGAILGRIGIGIKWLGQPSE